MGLGAAIGGIGALASAGAGIAGGLMGASAARKAAGQQADALRQALGFQQQVYGTATSNLQPYISGGTNALDALTQLYGLPSANGGSSGNALSAYSAFTKTPFYQFPLSQGTEAINRSGAARGLTMSGGQLNELQKYGAGYASSNFDHYVSALAGLANLGQSSGSALAGFGNQAAGTTLQADTGIGNALAAGTIGSQNQINNALGKLPLLLGGLGGTGNNNTGSSYGNNNSNPLQGSGGSSLGNVLSNLFGGGGGSGFVDSGSWNLPG